MIDYFKKKNKNMKMNKYEVKKIMLNFCYYIYLSFYSIWRFVSFVRAFGILVILLLLNSLLFTFI